jgi:hypothetical protein
MVLSIPGYGWPYSRLVVEGIVWPHDGYCLVVEGFPLVDWFPQRKYGPETGVSPQWVVSPKIKVVSQ